MPSAAPDEALRARFLADLSAALKTASLSADAPVGIALSGGPDSVALLLLARFAAIVPVRALTVDHGLRSEAADEAEAAASLCAQLGVPHETVRVRVGPGSVQAAARDARYAALGEWAEREGLAAVLTGHHADDQAETMLMRLSRGAGMAGLSGIRVVQRFESGLIVLRPLLGWRKADLETVCAAAGIKPARDPSNADPRYDRTRARALIARTDWLDPARLAASAAHLVEADAALSAIADDRYRPERTGDDVTLRPDPLREITRRHLVRLFDEEFGARPDGPSLRRAMAALESGGATTCAGILCRADPPVWRFRRAPPRRST